MFAIIIATTLFLACGSENKTTLDVAPVILNDSTGIINSESHVWINSTYFDCMKASLPCNCINTNEPVMLSFTKDSMTLRVYEGNYGFDELYLKGNKNKYSVLTHSDAIKPIYKLEIDNDTLCLFIDDRKITFYDSKHLEIKLKNESSVNLVGELNLILFKDYLSSLGYNESETIGKIADSSFFYCNKELGGVNLIFNEGECNDMRIIEIKDNELYIYTYLNSCEGKSLNPKIEKKLIRKVPLSK